MTKNITISIPDWVYYEIWQKIPHGYKSEFVEKALIASRDKIDELESNRQQKIIRDFVEAEQEYWDRTKT